MSCYFCFPNRCSCVDKEEDDEIDFFRVLAGAKAGVIKRLIEKEERQEEKDSENKGVKND